MKLYFLNIMITILNFKIISHGSYKFCPITALQRIQSIEEESIPFFNHFLQEFIRYSSEVIGLNLAFREIRLAGSVSEGSFAARLFSIDKEFPDQLHRQIETDLEFTMFEISDTYHNCYHDIESKPGFLEISIAGKNDSCVPPNARKFFATPTVTSVLKLEEISSADGFLLSNMIKAHYTDEMRFSSDHKCIKLTSLIMAFITNTPLSRITASRVLAESTKATSTFAWHLKVNDETKIKISSDFAFVLKLKWSPAVYKTLIKRWKSTWIPLSKIKQELDTGFVIAKPSNVDRKNMMSTEFRYSFAHFERKLINMQSKTQKQIYLIFKSLIYQWVKPIDPDHLSSFICKCTMLWESETFSPSHVLWRRNDALNTIKAVKWLLKKLHGYFLHRFMPYYFIPSINILERIPKQVITKVKKILFRMQYDIVPYLPRKETIMAAEKFVAGGLQTMLQLRAALDQIKRNGVFPFYLRKPELFFQINDLITAGKLHPQDAKRRNICTNNVAENLFIKDSIVNLFIKDSMTSSVHNIHGQIFK